MTTTTRIERDPLGEKHVPSSALYGIQTLRAAENFPDLGPPAASGVRRRSRLDQASSGAHAQRDRPTRGSLADAIVRAADEVLGGQHRDQFIVDVYQAGAGTSHNMNVNEVLANRANEMLGGTRGAYAPVHPNDHVNMAQSTNDVIPTAIRLAVAGRASRDATRVRRACATSLLAKGEAFDDIIKSGRTHLQDATPIRLGQEFTAYGHTVRAPPPEAGAGGRLASRAEHRRHAPSAPASTPSREYPALMVKYLRQVTGLDLREGDDRIQLMQSHGRRRHVERRVPRLRARSQQDRQRHPAARLRAAHRTRRDRAAGGAAGLQHHAGQGESVDRRDGEPGLLPGARAAIRRSRSRPKRASSSST